MIEIKDLNVGYSGRPILQHVSLAFQPGEVVVFAGPNGCGKSTLIRTMVGLLPKLSGTVLYDGIPMEQMSARVIARKAAYVAQSRNVPDIVARRMVLHGRFPYLSYPRRYRKEDYDAADQALNWVNAEKLADRYMPELSGGQRQKIYLAMALAQDTETIFMDEPTTYLDVHHQMEVVQMTRRLASHGKTVVMVLHDLCMAMQTADRIVVFDGGSVVKTGTPDEIYESGILDSVFKISLKRTMTEDGWQYYYQYLGKCI